MPFDSLDDLNSRDAYIAILKEELSALRGSGDAADFYFLEKFRFDGKNADPILIVGKVSSRFLTQLKQLPGDIAQGHCSVRGGDLRIMPKRGRAPESKLKTAMRGTGFKPDLIGDVTGKAEEEDQSDRIAAEKRFKEAQDQFEKVKKHIPPKERRELKTMFGKYDKYFKTKDFGGAQKHLSLIGDTMDEMLKHSMRESRAIIKRREQEQKRIHKKLGEVGALVTKLEKLVAEQTTQVTRLRDALEKAAPTRKNAEAIAGLKDRLAAHEKAVGQIREQSEKAKKQLTSDFDKLKSKTMRDPASQALATLAVSQSGRIRAMEKSLTKVPITDAKKLLARVIKALKEGVA